MSILATIRDAVSEAARAAIHQWQAEMTSTANRPSPTPTAATQTHGSVTARPGAAHHAVQESLQPPPESTLSILDRDFILFDTGRTTRGGGVVRALTNPPSELHGPAPATAQARALKRTFRRRVATVGPTPTEGPR